MRSSRLTLAAVLALGMGTSASAGVGYSVHIEAPAPDPAGGTVVARGDLGVQVRVEGGVGDATSAAFRLNEADGGWIDQERVDLAAVAPGRFASAEPWSTRHLPNDTYELEVRVWGDVPAYDPRNRGTYAVARMPLVVENPPPAPRPAATTGVRSVRVWWRDVPSAARSDFVGYRVWQAGGGCPDDAGRYRMVGETRGTSWASYAVPPGRACYRVTAVRSSVVRGTIDSAMSGPLAVDVPATAAAAAISGGRTVVAPRTATVEAPAAGRPGDDGGYDEHLPYGVAQPEPGEASEVAAAPTATSAGPLPQGGPASAAAGLLLLAGGFHIRRFLARGGAS